MVLIVHCGNQGKRHNPERLLIPVWDDKTDEELARIILFPEAQASSSDAMLDARGALNELLLRHYGWIMRVCVAELRSETLGLDCGQEILTRVSQGLKNFKFQSKFSTWCYVIVRRTIWEFRKDRKRMESREVLALDSTPAYFSAMESAIESVTGFDIFDSRQRCAALWDHIGELPTKQREAIILHYFEDLSVADAAERIGCSISSLKTHLFRGREKLKKLIESQSNSIAIECIDQ